MATATVVFSAKAVSDGTHAEFTTDFIPPQNVSGRSCYLKVTNVAAGMRDHAQLINSLQSSNYLVTMDFPQPYSWCDIQSIKHPTDPLITISYGVNDYINIATGGIGGVENYVTISPGTYRASSLAAQIENGLFDLDDFPALVVRWNESDHLQRFSITNTDPFTLTGDLLPSIGMTDPSVSTETEPIVVGDELYISEDDWKIRGRNRVVSMFGTGIPATHNLGSSRILVDIADGPQNVTVGLWCPNEVITTDIDQLTVMFELTPIDSGYKPDLSI